MMMRMEGGAILGLQIQMFCPRAYICSNFPAGDGQSKGRGQRNGKNPGWEISFHESVSVALSPILRRVIGCARSATNWRQQNLRSQRRFAKKTIQKFVQLSGSSKKILVQFFQLQIGQIFKDYISPSLLASYLLTITNFFRQHVMNCAFVFSLSPISSCIKHQSLLLKLD